MEVTTEEIQKLAKLSRLHLDEKEIGKLKESLAEIMGYIDLIKKLDLSDVEPMMLADQKSGKPWRQDSPIPSLSREEAFKNAPSIKDKHFAIPKSF